MLKNLILLITAMMISTVGFVTIGFAKERDGATGTQWEHLKNDAFQPSVRMSNNYSMDFLETDAEFTSRIEFFAFDKNNQPLKVFVPLRFETYMPRVVRPGGMKYFSDQIPLKFVFGDRFLDYSKVAYFKVHFYIYEDDFMSKETVIHMAVKFTPEGLVGFDKAKKLVVANKVSIKTSTRQPVEALGEFRIDKAQSTLEKIKTDAAVAESRVKDAVKALEEIEKNQK